MTSPAPAPDPEHAPGWACLLPAALLLPFLGKAFHIDDALFLYYARAIAKSPWNPLSQTVEWDGRLNLMFDLPNPLGWQYLLAGVRAVLGEREWALHLLTFAFAALGLHGMALLARKLGVSPLAACALLAGSSAFLVMGSTVMPDVPMVGCMLAGLGHLVWGVERQQKRELCIAGLWVGAGALMRYNGLLVLGLLLAYPLLARRWRWPSFLPFLIAVGVVAGWNLLSWAQQGEPHLLHTLRQWSRPLEEKRTLMFLFLELSHLGAQLPIALWALAPLVLTGTAGVFCALGGLAATMALGALQPMPDWHLEAVLFAWPAAAVLLRAAVLLWEGARARFKSDDEGRAALRWLCALWLWGTAFATTRYIHIAAKYLLLPACAALLLLLDGLSSISLPRAQRLARGWVSVTVPAWIALGMAIALSDYRLAGTYRALFERRPELTLAPGGRAYHSGNWGFRYYAERAGLLLYRGQHLGPKDRLLLTVQVPRNGPALSGPVRLVENSTLSYPGPFAILNRPLRAGFYSHSWGPYPFVPAARVEDTLFVVAGIAGVEAQ